jgi:hypothetical protein
MDNVTAITNTSSQIVSQLSFFIIGFILGFFVRIVIDNIKGKKGDFEIMTKGQGRTFIAFVVILIWVISILVEINNSEYHVSVLVHGIMGSVVSYFFLIKDGTNGNNKK